MPTPDYEARLQELGIELPNPPAPVANYLPCVLTGNLLFVGGVVCTWNDEVEYTGKLGADLSIEEGYDAARYCGLNHLAIIRKALGTLNRVERMVKVIGYVASAPGFVDQPAVINGESDLLVSVFGDHGRHTRLALGISEIGLHAPVETEVIVEVRR